MNELLPVTVLLGALAVFNFIMASLTLQEYADTEVANQVLTGSSVRIGIGMLSLILAFGINKRRSWALYACIIFMAFGIINSIWNIIVSARFELSIIFGMVMLGLFAITLYYIIKKRYLFA